MNILSRLKKLESRIVEPNSEFCECPNERSIRLPGEKPFPAICERCGKPLLIKVITFDFNSNVKLTGKA